MAAGAEGITGPRLEFVLKKLSGTVERFKYKAPPTKLEREKDHRLDKENANQRYAVKEDAGYMIFFPTGNSYRLNEKQMIQKGFDRQPDILSFEQANSNDTPAGRFKLARTENAKQRAWLEMEKQVIDACVHGDIAALVSDYDPKGKLEAVA